jgi:hypothetical protein
MDATILPEFYTIKNTEKKFQHSGTRDRSFTKQLSFVTDKDFVSPLID